jgi:hypothetical protein
MKKKRKKKKKKERKRGNSNTKEHRKQDGATETAWTTNNGTANPAQSHSQRISTNKRLFLYASPGTLALQATILTLSAVTESCSKRKVGFDNTKVHTSSSDR